MKRFLSIDPSSSAAGFALFVNDTPIWCTTIKPKGDNLIDRMAQLLVETGELLDNNKPDYIAIETPYLGLSRSTSMKMGQIFGMFCACIVMHGYTSSQILQIHPMTAKKAAGVTGKINRDSGKTLVLNAMKEKFPQLQITDDNSSDALAIGLAGIEMLQSTL